MELVWFMATYTQLHGLWQRAQPYCCDLNTWGYPFIPDTMSYFYLKKQAFWPIIRNFTTQMMFISLFNDMSESKTKSSVHTLFY